MRQGGLRSTECWPGSCASSGGLHGQRHGRSVLLGLAPGGESKLVDREGGGLGKPSCKSGSLQLQLFYAMPKPQLNVVVLGHTDSGKSSLIGHCLSKLKYVSPQDLGRAHREAEDHGHQNSGYSFVGATDPRMRSWGT